MDGDLGLKRHRCRYLCFYKCYLPRIFLSIKLKTKNQKIMVQIKEPTTKLNIVVQVYNGVENRYMAYMSDDDYRGIVVSAPNIEECLKHLAISIKTLDIYRENIKNKQQKN